MSVIRRQGWGGQVVTNDQLAVICTKFRRTIVEMNIHHDFGPLAVSKGGVGQSPLRIGHPSQHILTLYHAVAPSSPNWVKPQLLYTQQVILPLLLRSMCIAALCLLILTNAKENLCIWSGLRGFLRCCGVRDGCKLVRVTRPSEGVEFSLDLHCMLCVSCGVLGSVTLGGRIEHLLDFQWDLFCPCDAPLQSVNYDVLASILPGQDYPVSTPSSSFHRVTLR
jgi:hypothetical protein